MASYVRGFIQGFNWVVQGLDNLDQSVEKHLKERMVKEGMVKEGMDVQMKYIVPVSTGTIAKICMINGIAMLVLLVPYYVNKGHLEKDPTHPTYTLLLNGLCKTTFWTFWVSASIVARRFFWNGFELDQPPRRDEYGNNV
jgi:hypothetical protein